MAALETLRFVLLGDDRASSAFSSFARNVDQTTKAVDKNNLSLGDSKLKLDEIQKKADELGRLHPDLKVQVDDAAAKLKLAVLKHELNSIGNGPDIGSSGNWSKFKSALTGIIGSSASASGAGGSGLLGISATLPVLGTVGIPALVGLTAAAVLLGAALMPVVAALLPITIGFGTLAVVAGPEVKKVFDGITASGKDLHKALKDLSPAERDLVMQGRGLKDQFTALGTAVKPEILKAFADVLKIIKDLMPAIKPLVEAAAKALDKFLGQLVNWLQSPQGQSFVNWLKTVGPKDIMNFGRVLWDVAKTVGQALNAIYRAGSWIDRFVTRWHEDWILVKNIFRIIGDDLVIFALRTVSGILEPFTHIPLIGGKFKDARDAVNRELGRMVQDAKQASQQIQSAWDAIHAKSVPLNFDLNLPTGVHITSHAPEGRKHGAAGGLISGGTPGQDSVPAILMPGEVIVPTRMVQAGAVDHLRGRLPGFAAGGMVGYNIHDEFHPPVAAFDRNMVSRAADAISAIGNFVQKNFTVSGISAGFGGAGPGGPVEAVARALFPWAASQWPSFNAVEMREAGYSLTAQNPSSGAYGVAQFINGPSEYFQWGGSPFTAAGQFTAMFNYIRSRYGTPAAAWGHELGFGWYDQGGMLPPGLSLAYNGTGKPEPVGGGHTYNINVYPPVGSNPRDIARQLADILNHGAAAGVRLRKSILSANG